MSACRLCDVVGELLEIRTALRAVRGPRPLDGDVVRQTFNDIDTRICHVISALGATDAAWEEDAPRPRDPDDLPEWDDQVFALLPPGGDVEEAVAGPITGLAGLREAVELLDPGDYEVHRLSDTGTWLPWGTVQVGPAYEDEGVRVPWVVRGLGITLSPGAIIV